MFDSPLVVIAGPTASGKTALALQIAKKYNGEIICADSRTVYTGMDIGTAKPSKAEQKLIKHHLLDVVTPRQVFTAADFKRLAQTAIGDIAARGKLPIIVGGTGLYIDAVIFDYQFGPQADPELRSKLQLASIEELQQIIQERGLSLPVNSKNKRHLVRAIELNGTVSQKRRLRPGTIVVAITTSKEELHARIEKRAQQMITSGVLEETKKLAQVYGWESEAMTGNIYRILQPVLAGETTLKHALELFISSDVQLAKRQITWLKRNPYIVWGNAAQITLAIEHFVQQNKLAKSIPLAP